MSSTKLALNTVLSVPNSTVKIPQLGFGVYLSPRKQCIASCLEAFKAGYRHIDSAQYYENEQEVGDAFRESGLKRSEVFLTTKILFTQGDVEKNYESVLESVQKMDGKDGYIDLFLIHSPNAGKKARHDMWLALEKLHKAGKAKSIGVSNFGIGHIDEMKEYATVWPPMFNQLELHPWDQQRDIVDYCKNNKIIVEAYSPLVRNNKAKDPTLNKIADAHGKSTTQVLVRYCLQKGWVPLPKSDTPSRIVANADVYDFELSAKEMETLDGLDQEAEGSIVQHVTNTL